MRLLIGLIGLSLGAQSLPFGSIPISSGGGGPTAPINSAHCHGVTNGCTTGAVDMTSGSTAKFCVMGVSAFTAGPADSVSSSPANTWTALASPLAGNANSRITLYYASPATVSNVMTFSNTPTGTTLASVVAACFGAAGSLAFVTQNGASSQTISGTAANPGALSVTSGDLVISWLGGALGSSGVYAVDSSFLTPPITELSDGSTYFGSALSYWIASSSTSPNPGWTATGGADTVGLGIANFR